MADGPQIFDFDPRYRPRPRIATPAFNPNAGSALDYLNDPLGPARPVPAAIPPPSPPPSLGLPPEDLPQQPPPDPYGEAVERRRTLREAPPTAVPGQPPWWKQILGYAAESFRPTSGMGIGDRLFGVAGAKQEAAGRAQELKLRGEDIDIAKGLAAHQRGMSQDVEKARQFGIEQEGQDRRAGWVVKQPDDPESKFHHVTPPNASGVVMGLLRKESTEAMQTVRADIAKAMGIPVGEGQTKERVSVKAYGDWLDFSRSQTVSPGGAAFRPSLTGPSEQVASVDPRVPSRQFRTGPEGRILEALPGSAPGTALTPITGPSPSRSGELSPTSIASNKRQIENDYNEAVRGADLNFTNGIIAMEGISGEEESSREGIESLKNLRRDEVRKAADNRDHSYRVILGIIAPAREPPTLPGEIPEAEHPALPELAAPRPPPGALTSRPTLELPPVEQTPAELGRQLKQQYPGEYDDWSDEELGQRYLNKQRGGNAR